VGGGAERCFLKSAGGYNPWNVGGKRVRRKGGGKGKGRRTGQLSSIGKSRRSGSLLSLIESEAEVGKEKKEKGREKGEKKDPTIIGHAALGKLKRGPEKKGKKKK